MCNVVVILNFNAVLQNINADFLLEIGMYSYLNLIIAGLDFLSKTTISKWSLSMVEDPITTNLFLSNHHIFN